MNNIDFNKKLTFFGLTMVATGSCIGSGIFLTPSSIAATLPNGWMITGAWSLGGVITLTGALTFAELGSMFPAEGGVYVYIKEAFGDFMAFLYGWAVLLIITSGAIAALALAFARYIDVLMPLSDIQLKLLPILAILTVTLLNVRGVNYSQWLTNSLTILKLGGIALIIFVGLTRGSTGTLSLNLASSSSGFSSFFVAMIGVLWSFGGWHHASFLAGEAINAKETVPRAMIMGAVLVTGVYILVNFAYMMLLELSTISSSQNVAADALNNVMSVGGSLIAGIIAVSVLGTIAIYSMSAPRLYYTMGKDKVFFPVLGKLHKEYRTPAVAMYLQCSWSIILVLFWGTFENVITYALFTSWIFLSMAALGIFILRKKLPDRNRPYRTTWYPITPIVFISASWILVINTLLKRPIHALAGLVLILLGLPFYFYFVKHLNDK